MDYSPLLTNVALVLVYLLCGFIAVKAKKAETSHARSLSGILIYVLGPGMVLNAFQKTEFSKEALINMGLFFLMALIAQFLFFLLLFLLFRKKMEDARLRILSVGGVVSNAGFFGLPIISGLFPAEPIVSCYSIIYCAAMNVVVFTVGIFMLTRDKRYMSLKSAVINPTVLSMAVALPMFILDFHFPAAFCDVFSLFSKMTTPLCMMVLGMRLASMDLKKVFLEKFAYVTALVKLIIFPLFSYLLVVTLPFGRTFQVSMLVLSACPTAAVLLSMAELHKTQQELSANVVLLTTLFSVLTIPLIMLIV